MNKAPFTVSADLDLRRHLSSLLVGQGADVMIRRGDVPEYLEGEGPEGAAYQVRDRRMLLKVPNGMRYLIEDGRRITYAPQAGHTERDIALFLLGSAWAALCYQRGLLPLHASAIMTDGAVHAFTGPSGTGKSTLVAELTARGRPFFTDDILILDPSSLDPLPLCFAAQQELKLWADAITMTGAERGESIRSVAGFEKYHARPGIRSSATTGRLINLFFLTRADPGREPRIEHLEGSTLVVQLVSSIYRPAFATAILGRRILFEMLSGLVGKVGLLQFERPFDHQGFAAGVDYLDRWIDEHG